jgi:outer membrane protein assembly factor BamB
MASNFSFKCAMLVCFGLCIKTTAFCQNNFAPKVDSSLLGQCLEDKTQLNGKKLTFTSQIISTYIDTTLNLLFVHFRTSELNDGKIRAFNLSTMRAIWDDDLSANAYYQFVGHELYISNGSKTRSINLLNGEKSNKYKGVFIRFFPSQNMGIFYRGATLVGIALNSGEEVWERDLNIKSKVPKLLTTKTDEALLIAEGLHTLDIKTGKGWTVESSMEDKHFLPPVLRKERDAYIAGGLLGAGIGFLTGAIVFPIAYQSAFASFGPVQIQSNIISTDTSYLIASRESLLHIRKSDGQLLWKSSVHKTRVSDSRILLKNGMVYFLNKGETTDQTGTTYEYGAPYICAYDLKDGRRMFYQPTNNQSTICFPMMMQDKFVFFQEDTIHLHNALNGNAESFIPIDTATHGPVKYGVKGDCFLFDSLSLKWVKDTNAILFVTEKGMLLGLSFELKLTEIQSERYYKSSESSEAVFYRNMRNKGLFIEDKSAKRTYQVSDFQQAEVQNGYMIARSGNTLHYCKLKP